MAAEIVVFGGLAVALALVLWRLFPAATRRWFERLSLGIRIFWGVVAISMAIVFIGTGATGFVILGMAIIVLWTLTVVFREPWQGVDL